MNRREFIAALAVGVVCPPKLEASEVFEDQALVYEVDDLLHEVCSQPLSPGTAVCMAGDWVVFDGGEWKEFERVVDG